MHSVRVEAHRVAIWQKHWIQRWKTCFCLCCWATISPSQPTLGPLFLLCTWIWPLRALVAMLACFRGSGFWALQALPESKAGQLPWYFKRQQRLPSQHLDSTSGYQQTWLPVGCGRVGELPSGGGGWAPAMIRSAKVSEGRIGCGGGSG